MTRRTASAFIQYWLTGKKSPSGMNPAQHITHPLRTRKLFQEQRTRETEGLSTLPSAFSSPESDPECRAGVFS